LYKSSCRRKKKGNIEKKKSSHDEAVRRLIGKVHQKECRAKGLVQGKQDQRRKEKQREKTVEEKWKDDKERTHHDEARCPRGKLEVRTRPIKASHAWKKKKDQRKGKEDRYRRKKGDRREVRTQISAGKWSINRQ